MTFSAVLGLEGGPRNPFRDAAHIPPEYCRDDVERKLGSGVLDAVNVDVSLAIELDPKTAADNRERARSLPPPPESTINLYEYIKKYTWDQQRIILPDSEIIIDIKGNIELDPVDPRLIDDAIRGALGYDWPDNPLQGYTYDCLYDGIYNQGRLSGHRIELVYLQGIVIRGDLAVKRAEGAGVTGGRFRHRHDQIILTAGNSLATTNPWFFHEFGHAINYAMNHESDVATYREFVAVGFSASAMAESVFDRPLIVPVSCDAESFSCQP